MPRGIYVLIGAAFIMIAGLFFYLTMGDTSRHLVFATWGTPTEVESFKRLIDHFNTTRRPVNKVKLSHLESGSYAEQLLVKAAARDFPDVIHIDQKELAFFEQKGLLENLAPYVERDTSFNLGIFFPRLVENSAVKGLLYGVPHNFSTLVLYYNKDHFDAEGLPYPDSTWTWNDLLHAAQLLTKRGTDGTILRYGCYLDIIVHTLIYQSGGRILNESLDSCVIASPESEEAIQFLVDLSERYHVTWNVLSRSVNWDDMFAGGRCSMVANGRWAATWYAQSMPRGALDVAPLPRGRFRKGAMVNHMMAMSAHSTKKEDAWEFIEFLASEPAQRMVNEDGANIPARRSVAESEDFLRHKKTPNIENRVFIDELPHSVGWPFNQGPYLTLHSIQTQIDLVTKRILLGTATTRESLRAMEDEINRVIMLRRATAEPRPFVGSRLFYACVCVLAVPLLLALKRRTGK